eukprot:Nitzschia sp. Nitz4//scaffold13_size275219//126816//129570//NITZ4_000872-RA/size275219-augustus-gene-0.232-mRNA-1//1//CDS//3329536008//491//frame0
MSYNDNGNASNEAQGDEDIGAFLLWDDNEDNGGEANVDILAGTSETGTESLDIPLPTRINFADGLSPTLGGAPAPGSHVPPASLDGSGPHGMPGAPAAGQGPHNSPAPMGAPIGAPMVAPHHEAYQTQATALAPSPSTGSMGSMAVAGQQVQHQAALIPMASHHPGHTDNRYIPQYAFTADPSHFMQQMHANAGPPQFHSLPPSQSPNPPIVEVQRIQYHGSTPQVTSHPPAAQVSGAKAALPIVSAALSYLPTSTSHHSLPTEELAASINCKPPSDSASVCTERSDPLPSKKAARRRSDVDTSTLSVEEKAKANRDRNREHARNTRLRKKAYLEKLKNTVNELCRERDTLMSERNGAANVLAEINNTRADALMSFFTVRATNERRRELWSKILDESCVTCRLPVTPYRSFPASEVQVSKCQRTVTGIDGMMADAASLHVLVNSLVDRSRFPNATIDFRYRLLLDDAVVAGNQMMARWEMITTNAVKFGAKSELVKQGMLCCKFNDSHKIIGLELMFDVMALMLQLKQAAGSDSFSVVPNTVQTCQRSFDKPMVMTLAEEPYTIVQVNKLWEEMTGYKAEDVVGKSSLRILEGEGTDPNAVEAMLNEMRHKRPASAMLLHYKRNGESFRNFFFKYPLSSDSKITHYLTLSTLVDNEVPVPAEAAFPPLNQQGVIRSEVPVASQQTAAVGTPQTQPAIFNTSTQPTVGATTNGTYPTSMAQPAAIPANSGYTSVPALVPAYSAVPPSKRPNTDYMASRPLKHARVASAENMANGRASPRETYSVQ